MRLIGGEMTNWSDQSSAVGGAVLHPLLAFARGRTLIVGPHDPALVDALPAEQLTVLVRGVEDGSSFGPDLDVRCGSLTKMDETYDTVVALAGLGRVRSVEDEPAVATGWADDFALLLGVLRPGGRLLLGLANPVGLHRLIELPPEPGNADWIAPDAHDPTRPTGLAGLRAQLAAAGLTLRTGYAAYPEPVAPTVLLGPEVSADPELVGFLEASLRAAVEPTGTVLADPRRLVSDLLHQNLAADLAPGWIIVADRNMQAQAQAQAHVEVKVEVGPELGADEIPFALLATNAGVEQLRRDSAGRWVQRSGKPVPLGRNLHDLLLSALLRRDQPTARDLLAAWQQGTSAGVRADQVVVDSHGELHPVEPAGAPADAMRHLASTLLAYGYLWPSPTDEIGLSVLLAGMAGLELEPASSGPDERAFRELLISRDRLARELANAQDKQQWYERMLAARADELKRVRRINAVLAATVPGRAATASIGGLRAGRRAVRAVVRRLKSR